MILLYIRLHYYEYITFEIGPLIKLRYLYTDGANYKYVFFYF